MEQRKREKLLTRMVEYVNEMADSVNSPNPTLSVHLFVQYSRIGSTFIGFLGLPFKFAQMEFLSKVTHYRIHTSFYLCLITWTKIDQYWINLFFFCHLRKINDLSKGARPDDTLDSLIDREIEQNSAKNPYSSSRSLIRVNRSILLITDIFEQMLTTGVGILYSYVFRFKLVLFFKNNNEKD